MKNYIMAYDFGTSGTKAALVDYDGSLLGTAVCDYPLLSFGKGYAEQDPNEYWRATCAATRRVLKTSGIIPGQVKGMIFSTQGMGIIPVDHEGKVLYNNITWVDSRAGDQAKAINSMMGKKAAGANDVIAKLLWIKENLLDLYENTEYFFDCTGYLTWRATGIAAMEMTDSGPYSSDPARQRQKEALYQAVGIDLKKMPPNLVCSRYVGQLTANAAEELGLTQETAVYMGTGDVAAAAAGCGCLEEGDAHIYLGSSAWLSVIIGGNYQTGLSDGIYQLGSICEDHLIYGGCVQSCGIMLNYGLDRFYPEFGREDALRQANEDAGQIPAGSEGLFVTPWLFGERCPILDEKIRAAFINVSEIHTRGHYMRAIMEGVAYSLNGQIQDYQKDMGRKISSLTVVGGGASSDVWMQILADVTGIRTVRPSNIRHSGALGAAFAAGIGMGLYDSSQIKKRVSVERIFVPKEEVVGKYKKSGGIFEQIYPSLRELYRALNG